VHLVQELFPKLLSLWLIVCLALLSCMMMSTVFPNQENITCFSVVHNIRHSAHLVQELFPILFSHCCLALSLFTMTSTISELRKALYFSFNISVCFFDIL
jgi:hypothetical protein